VIATHETSARGPREAVARRSDRPVAARFHACPIEPGCPHCAGMGDCDWSFVDAVYCISLADRPDRAALAAQELHRVGLCRRVLFYRPDRHRGPVIEGIWESHRAVADHALRQGARTALILEDDAAFGRWVGPRTAAAVAAALRTLPDDWMIYFLGHWPLRARFVRPNVLRTRSGCAHAYIASERLLHWLRDTPFRKEERERSRIVGGGIDASYANMDQAFAHFPMLAIQAVRGSDHIAFKKRKRRVRKLRHLVTRTNAGEVLLSHLMRPNELLQAGIAVVAGAGALLVRPFQRGS
jgi:hypothetical protein